MTTDFPGYNSPQASTEVPLEMLSACHHRIEQKCQTLARLADHLAQYGSDKEAQEAARGLLRYFDTAALQHHADEEEDLFPALLEAMAGSDAVCIRELVEHLTLEHRQLEHAFSRLRAPLNAVAAGEAVQLDAPAVHAFVDHYQRHIQREEDELLPMAQRLLLDLDITRIGRAMRLRRGIPDD